MTPPVLNRIAVPAIFAALALALSLLAAFNQVKAQGLSWQEAHYYPALEAAIGGEPGEGGLSAAMTMGLKRTLEWAGAPRPAGLAMVGLRVAQNLALLLFCYGYYRRLGIRPYPILLGWMTLAWAMTHTTWQTTLAFDTYTECLLAVAAVWAVASGQSRWCVPLAVLAALNKSTGWILPLTIFAAALGGPVGLPAERKRLVTPMAAAIIYVAVLIMVREYTAWHHFVPRPQGWEQLSENLRNPHTWGQLAGTFGVLPFLAVLGWTRTPQLVHYTAAATLPLCFAWHFTHSDAAATHVFLLPLVVCVLPAALFALQAPPAEESAP